MLTVLNLRSHLLVYLGMLASVMANSLMAEETGTKTALDEYVARPDDTYQWQIMQTMKAQGLTAYIVDLKSQTWRSSDEVNRTVWQHWLMIVKPDDVKFDTAMLFIGGGSNDGDPPNGPNERIMKLAAASKSVVAELKMVPNQPLIFHGDGQPRKEDDLVAYTWDQYLKTGDPTWPARNPMVKSAVRAMDTITAVLQSAEGGHVEVDKFVVAGGSKRGWTTWLTGAVDQRVVAISPIVIDVLNVEVSMRHHYAAYGFWAPAVGDYVHHKIFRHLGSPQMKKLQELVDPYCYRDRLTMPKYILNGSGDQFFLPDSSQFYFDDLTGDKYLRYVPNADHSLNGSDAVESLLAFYLTVLHKKPRPEIRWTFEDDGAIRVIPSVEPKQVLLWQATNPQARDFRLETLGPKYEETELTQQGDGSYVGNVTPPAKGWTAYFLELTFDLGIPVPFKQTTAVRVVPNTLPYADKDPAASSQ
jgi:PhoPQ-activated pathogenicity-related protein